MRPLGAAAVAWGLAVIGIVEASFVWRGVWLSGPTSTAVLSAVYAVGFLGAAAALAARSGAGVVVGVALAVGVALLRARAVLASAPSEIAATVLVLDGGLLLLLAAVWSLDRGGQDASIVGAAGLVMALAYAGLAWHNGRSGAPAWFVVGNLVDMVAAALLPLALLGGHSERALSFFRAPGTVR